MYQREVEFVKTDDQITCRTLDIRSLCTYKLFTYILQGKTKRLPGDLKLFQAKQLIYVHPKWSLDFWLLHQRNKMQCLLPAFRTDRLAAWANGCITTRSCLYSYGTRDWLQNLAVLVMIKPTCRTNTSYFSLTTVNQRNRRMLASVKDFTGRAVPV